MSPGSISQPCVTSTVVVSHVRRINAKPKPTRRMKSLLRTCASYARDTMSEERLRWLSIVFATVVVGVVFPNIASLFWVPFVASQLPGDDAASTTGRVRMIFPVMAVLSIPAKALVAYAAARTASAALKEPASSRIATATSLALAVLAAGVLALRALFVIGRYVGVEIDTLISATEIAETTLVVAIAASLAQDSRGRGAGMVAVGMLVLALALGIANATTTLSSVIIVLATLGAWIAIGMGLRRVRPLAASPPSIASTFE